MTLFYMNAFQKGQGKHLTSHNSGIHIIFNAFVCVRTQDFYSKEHNKGMNKFSNFAWQCKLCVFFCFVYLHGLLGTIIDGQSSSCKTCATA